MIHKTKDAEAYRHMLEVLKYHAEKQHGKSLVEQSKQPIYRDRRQRDVLSKHCIEVFEDGFAPSFMMIDGDDAERIAREQVFLGLPIQMC